VQQRLIDGFDEMNRHKGIPMRCQGTTGAFVILPGVSCEVAYTDDDLADLDIKLMVQLQQELQTQGVITRGGGTFYLTTASSQQ